LLFCLSFEWKEAKIYMSEELQKLAAMLADVNGIEEELRAFAKETEDTIENIKNLEIDQSLKDNIIKMIRHAFSQVRIFSDFEITQFEGNPVIRNHRLYPQVIDVLDDLKKLYPQYTLQDIINTKLYELKEYVK